MKSFFLFKLSLINILADMVEDAVIQRILPIGVVPVQFVVPALLARGVTTVCPWKNVHGQ